MFAFLLLIFSAPLPFVPAPFSGPAPGISVTKREARNIECTELSEAEAHALYPGQVSEPSVRGGYITHRAVSCKTRVFGTDERPGRDEAVLSRLTETVAELASAVDEPALAGANWMVDAFYPDPSVAAKLSFAAKVALAERGRKVSDRVPVLAAGDVLVMSRMPAAKAYPLACARFFAEGALGTGDVFLGVIQVDDRETILHAGLCVNGGWRWVR